MMKRSVPWTRMTLLVMCSRKAKCFRTFYRNLRCSRTFRKSPYTKLSISMLIYLETAISVVENAIFYSKAVFNTKISRWYLIVISIISDVVLLDEVHE